MKDIRPFKQAVYDRVEPIEVQLYKEDVHLHKDPQPKTILILNTLLQFLQKNISDAYAPLAKMIGWEKVATNNLHKLKHIKIAYTNHLGERIVIPFKVWKRYWITGRGIGKSWWPHLTFQFENSLGIKEDSAFLVKNLNEASFPVRASKKVYEEVLDQYELDYEPYTTRNETQSSGFIKAYDRPFEQAKRDKIYRSNIMMTGSFDQLTKLAHRVNEAGIITSVKADELVSHNAKTPVPSAKEWKDNEDSIKGSLFKKAKDRNIPYCLDAYMNKWEKNFPIITYADRLIDYDDFVRPYFLEDPVNNNFVVFYIPEDETCIVNATKFNSMVIREDPARQDSLKAALDDAIIRNDAYVIAEILGELYEGADDDRDYIYRNSLYKNYEYGIFDGEKMPIVDVGIDIDPNEVVEVCASQALYVNGEPHINSWMADDIPVDFKGRYPTYEEQYLLAQTILERISEITMNNGLYVRNVHIDDGFGWLVGMVEKVAKDNGIEGITFDKPRQKKDEWNILTRQLFFTKFFPKFRIHFSDDQATRNLLEDFKDIKKGAMTLINHNKAVNKRQDGIDHRINAWEYSLQTIKDMFYGDDDFYPVKTDYTL